VRNPGLNVVVPTRKAEVEGQGRREEKVGRKEGAAEAEGEGQGGPVH